MRNSYENFTVAVFSSEEKARAWVEAKNAQGDLWGFKVVEPEYIPLDPDLDTVIYEER
jgi:hypothetical protein